MPAAVSHATPKDLMAHGNHNPTQFLRNRVVYHDSHDSSSSHNTAQLPGFSWLHSCIAPVAHCPV